ncbi:MAG: hypothetical protein KKF56_00815 [Nanoarchaeota archaeon]|nr:hypothetical protein [Nanoarchaeota archaeon]
MAVETILQAPLFVEIIFPFLLVFVLIFAILEKSKVLGDDKHQINAVVALVVGLIFIAFPYPRSIVVNLMPFLAVVAVIILVFMVLFGFVAAGKEGFTMNKGLKITFGVLIAIALVIAVLVSTDYWDTVIDVFQGESSGTLITTIIFVAIIGGAIAVVLTTGGDGKSGS